jgi:preprotein translocase subunit YajC
MDALLTVLPLVLIVAVFYLLIFRPMQKRNRDYAETQAALRPGVRVMLGGGLYATVTQLDDEDVVVEAAPGVQLRYSRQGVVKVVDQVGPSGPSA